MTAIKKCSVFTDLLAFLQCLFINLHFLFLICLEVIFLFITITLHTFFCRVLYSEHGGYGNTQVKRKKI